MAAMGKKALTWSIVLTSIPVGLGLILWSPLFIAYGLGIFVGTWIGHDFAVPSDPVRKEEIFPASIPGEVSMVSVGRNQKGKERVRVVRPPAGDG